MSSAVRVNKHTRNSDVVNRWSHISRLQSKGVWRCDFFWSHIGRLISYHHFIEYIYASKVFISILLFDFLCRLLEGNNHLIDWHPSKHTNNGRKGIKQRSEHCLGISFLGPFVVPKWTSPTEREEKIAIQYSPH